MIEDIVTKLSKGIYKEENVRHSFNIGVSDYKFNNGKTIACQIIIDDIYDLEGVKLFNVERRINLAVNYFATEIFDYKKGYYLPRSAKSPDFEVS